MQRIHITTAIILFATTACFEPINPCETSLLYSNLTAEEKEACDECNDLNGCEGAETGEDESLRLTCSTDLDYHATARYCAVGEWSGLSLGEDLNQVVQIDASECRTLSTNTFPCYRSWYDTEPQDVGPSECVLCDALDAGITLSGGGGGWDELGPYAPRDVEFGLCGIQWSAPNYTGLLTFGSGWVPSSPYLGLEGAQTEAAEQDWSQPLGCPYDLLGDPNETGEPFSCDVVHVYDPSVEWSNEVATNWTCACPTGADSECQPGAVCQAGWVLDGPFPKPTLCTWDDGSGTPNGIAPEGPVVYGLGEWSDGIIVDGDRVTLTPSMFMALPTGVINDDHRFGLAGEFTRCGPDSLCAHLGMAEGDLVVVDEATVTALAEGRTVNVPVLSATGEERTLVVSLGDL